MVLTVLRVSARKIFHVFFDTSCDLSGLLFCVCYENDHFYQTCFNSQTTLTSQTNTKIAKSTAVLLVSMYPETEV